MTFNDKVTYRRLRDRDPRLEQFCDKLHMREYAVQRLGTDCVPELIHVGATVSDFTDLIGPFALKANHGSGWVTFVETGKSLTNTQLEEAHRWLNADFTAPTQGGRGEWGYRDARRLVYAEELLPALPPDYKFFMSLGQAELIQVDIDRFGDHQRALLLPDWIPIEGSLAYPSPDTTPPRPPNLATMLEGASALAKSLEFVRVDLYDLGARVLVGELTPYPGGGLEAFCPKQLDRWLGAKWSLG